MNIISKQFLIGAAAAFTLAACSPEKEIAGEWIADTPDDLTEILPGSKSATSLMNLSFMVNKEKTGGIVAIADKLNISKEVTGDSIAGMNYTVEMSGSATVSGTWTHDTDDKDELLITFHYPTIEINIKKEATTINPSLEGKYTPSQIDSIKTTAIAGYMDMLYRNFRNGLARFTVMDDIRVTDNGKKLKFEVERPEQELYFTKAETGS